jgi:hypothetical protein
LQKLLGKEEQMTYSEIKETASVLSLNLEALRENSGEISISESEALRRSEVLLGIIETPWAFPSLEWRERAADYLSVLTQSFPVVCRLVMSHAAQHAENVREERAGSWHPVAIDVLAKGPRCPELSDFLVDLLGKHFGTAYIDTNAALACISAGH